MNLLGPHGSAKAVSWVEEGACVLSQWLITSQGFHPIWNQWLLSVIHLRETEGQPAPVKNFPEATHEISVIVLNPEFGPYDPVAATFHILTPANVVEQFVATDEQATKLLMFCAQGILDGRLTPEPEGIQGAREFWAKAIAATLDHDKDPHHGRLN